LIGALALTVIVQSGQTLSGIASSHGVSLASVEAANPQISNPNLIYVGEKVYVTGGHSSWTPPSSYSHSSGSPAAVSYSPSHSASYSTGSTGGGLSDVPGVPSSFASCVAYRESTDGAGSSNIYGITPGSGVSVAGDSIAQQKQAFAQMYAQQGTAPWGPFDGC